MSKVQEIERAAENLSQKDLAELAIWIQNRLGQILEKKPQTYIRNHSAFLNGYSPQDEGLYDDGITR